MKRVCRRAAVYLMGGVAFCTACATARSSDASLHVVDGVLVHSRPAAPEAYASYLRARFALEARPRQLDTARQHIDQALRFDPRDPQLWTTRAEILAFAGAKQEAIVAARRALALSPSYGPAQRLLVALGGSNPSQPTPR